jgi:hypothetical protein
MLEGGKLRLRLGYRLTGVLLGLARRWGLTPEDTVRELIDRAGREAVQDGPGSSGGVGTGSEVGGELLGPQRRA